jgi:hypothetical protein
MIPYPKETVAGCLRLSRFQKDRVGERIEELTAALYGGRTWPQGERFKLNYPPP